MKRHRMAAIGLLIATTCTSRTSLAVGDNLVANGAFNKSLRHWTASVGSCSFLGGICWVRLDADESPTSGSVSVTATLPIIVPVMSLTSECVPVTGGDDYVLGFAMRFNFIGTREASVGPLWFDDPECQSGGDFDPVLVRSDGGFWEHRLYTLTSPASAVAARVHLDAGDRASLYFDNVRLRHLEPGEGTTTSTIMRECIGDCGNPLITTELPIRPIKPPDASDALYILLTAIGQHPPCQPCICDVDSDGEVSATDALLTLAFAVGEPVTLTCPAP